MSLCFSTTLSDQEWFAWSQGPLLIGNALNLGNAPRCVGQKVWLVEKKSDFWWQITSCTQTKARVWGTRTARLVWLSKSSSFLEFSCQDQIETHAITDAFQNHLLQTKGWCLLGTRFWKNTPGDTSGEIQIKKPCCGRYDWCPNFVLCLDLHEVSSQVILQL